MTNDEITLGDLIMQLRRELEAAQQDDPEHPIRFGVGPIELETTLSVTKAQEGDVGLVLKVLSLGGKRSSEGSNTTRVHLILTPTDSRSADQNLTVLARDTERDGPSPSQG
jgi:Trypsin-co-occurring domain 2